jgi:medium-chain acyl-[acyl-carrier-protein] hydrolase
MVMTGLAATDRWFPFIRPRPGAEVRLFCFPYAGGGASVFRDWAGRLPGHVEVCPVQLPGRETRFREPAFTRVAPLVEALAQSLRPKLDRPFAFFGHSLGALVAFELSRRLQRDYRLQPTRLFVSACEAPQIRSPGKALHTLPPAEFREELHRLNGTPDAILDNDELMELLLPTLWADFSVYETYTYVSGPPLTCPITVLGGLSDDTVSRQGLDAWCEQTTGPFRLLQLPGDHFFLNSAQPLLIHALARDFLEAKYAPVTWQSPVLSVREGLL